MYKYCIGIDLGGTTCKFGLFELSGKLLDRWSVNTNKTEDGRYILAELITSLKAKLLHANISEGEVKGIGLGIPGLVTGDGKVSLCANLGWKNKSVIEELIKITSIPVLVGNDANLAALGEMWKGSAKGYRTLVMITIGTGIGGGIIVNENMITGLNGAAGEIGHMPLVKEEQSYCGCGKRGCLEQAASATGIVREAKRLLENSELVSIMRNYNNLSAKQVFASAIAGDEVANQVIDRAARYLGIAIASIASVLDPEVFILGGGVSAAGELLIDRVKKHYQENVLSCCKETQIIPASLGNDAGIYGAAKMIASI